MGYLISDREREILRAFFESNQQLDGFDATIEKMNQYDLNEIADEVLLIKRTQTRFPSNEVIRKIFENAPQYYEKQLDALKKKETLIQQITDGDLSSVSQEIPEILRSVGLINRLFHHIESHGMRSRIEEPWQIFRLVTNMELKQKEGFRESILNDFRKKLERYRKDVEMSQEEFDSRLISSGEDYDYFFENRGSLEDMIGGIQVDYGYPMVKRLFKPDWIADYLKELDRLDEKMKLIYPKILMLQLGIRERENTIIGYELLGDSDFWWNRMLCDARVRYKVKKIPSEVRMPGTLLLSLGRALIGVIPPSLRGVTVGWDDRKVAIRFIFTEEVSNEDAENMSVAISEVYADFPKEYLIEDEIVRVDYPSPMEPFFLKLWAYRRKES